MDSFGKAEERSSPSITLGHVTKRLWTGLATSSQWVVSSALGRLFGAKIDDSKSASSMTDVVMVWKDRTLLPSEIDLIQEQLPLLGACRTGKDIRKFFVGELRNAGLQVHSEQVFGERALRRQSTAHADSAMMIRAPFEHQTPSKAIDLSRCSSVLPLSPSCRDSALKQSPRSNAGGEAASSPSSLTALTSASKLSSTTLSAGKTISSLLLGLSEDDINTAPSLLALGSSDPSAPSSTSSTSTSSSSSASSASTPPTSSAIRVHIPAERLLLFAQTQPEVSDSSSSASGAVPAAAAAASPGNSGRKAGADAVSPAQASSSEGPAKIPQPEPEDEKLVSILRLHAPWDFLVLHAERLLVGKRTLAGVTVPFSAKLAQEGVFANFPKRVDRPSARHFFTESERQSIVGDVVEHLRDPRTGYAFVPCLANLGLLELFPLHNPRALNGVMRLHHANPGSPAATKAVAGYFGSEIALYFSWLAHYNSSLVLPALVGVLLYWFSTSAYTSPSAFVFSVFFFLLWTIVMLEQWKRRQSEVAFDLEVADSEDKEAFLAPRPAFIGNLHQNPRTGEFDLRYPKSRRRCKYLATIPTVLGLTGLTCYGTMVFLRLSDQFTAWVEATDTVLWIPSAKPLLVLLPTLVYSVAVPVFNGLYTNVATKLTDWENYREKSDYESSLAVKLFLFYFVNSYSALFYLAFIAQDIDRLRTYLASLLVTSQFMGQVLEVGTPILQYYLNVASYVKQIRTKLASEPEGPSSSSAPFSPPSTFTPSGIKIARARRTPHAANANANGDTHGAGATGAAAGDSKNNTNVSTSSASHSSAARRSSGLLMNLPSLLRKSSAAIFGSPSKMAGEEDAGDVKNPSAGQAGGLKAKAGDASGTGNSSEKEEGEEDEVEEEEEEEEKREVRIDHVLREAQLAGRVSLFDEHIELVIQLGYVCMFGWAWPLAALFALLNNVIEIRSDLIKFAVATRRPFSVEASTIGVWNTLLRTIAIAGVITNCAFLAIYLISVWPRTVESLGSTAAAADILWLPDVWFYSLSRENQVIMAVIIEHIVMAAFFLISAVVSPNTERVRIGAQQRRLAISTLMRGGGRASSSTSSAHSTSSSTSS